VAENSIDESSFPAEAIGAPPYFGQPGPPRLASFLRRVVATVIDQLIILLGITAVALTAVLLLGGVGFLLYPLLILVPALYCAYFWSTTGATPGKAMLGIKVVDTRTGGNLTFGRGLWRFAGYYASSALLFLGYFWALFDDRNRAWHDILFTTEVRHR
jgi:uncharacterized RDD family membrane protein YckC